VVNAGSRPPWIRVRVGQSEALLGTRERLRAHGLHTVCEEAACPNMGHCWAHGRATILILGDRCTRGCRFCNVDKRPALPPDPDEPRRVAAAVREAGLKDVAITSVTRDDLPDGGAAFWAETVRAVQKETPGTRIEVLVPDFGGDPHALATVLQTRPAIFGHNLETVPRLYPQIRPPAPEATPAPHSTPRQTPEATPAPRSAPRQAPEAESAPRFTPRQADYARSLRVLRQATDAGLATKTSLMLGMGETLAEVEAVMRDARSAGCTIFYAGQYLQPTPRHAPVVRYVEPSEFDALRDTAHVLGFTHVASAPLIRSSYSVST